MEKEFYSLIRELLEKKFIINGVSILETGELSYELTGFYKSGSVQLYRDSNYIYALSRYGQIDILNDNGENPFNNLVDLNYNWWQRSKDMGDFWQNPETVWLPYLISMGYVKEVVETKTKYV